jgi:thiol-disulfide isomerase/thioredoxin
MEQMMEKIQSTEQLEEIKNSENAVLLFSAQWCGDCRFLEMFLPEIIKENKDYTFYYVDREQFIDVCISLDIYGIPSFIVFNKGEEIGRFVSKNRKTKEEVNEFLAGIK